jgi:hypothetical protein
MLLFLDVTACLLIFFMTELILLAVSQLALQKLYQRMESVISVHQTVKVVFVIKIIFTLLHVILVIQVSNFKMASV